jgi:putative transposase
MASSGKWSLRVRIEGSPGKTTTKIYQGTWPIDPLIGTKLFDSNFPGAAFIPKGRKKALYGKIRKFLGPVLREVAGQRGSTIVEGHMVQDHVHLLIRIPPKYAVAEVIGSIKGKSAIAVARQCGGRQRNFHGERFWARGYAVSTVGFEEVQIRAYIKHQEQLDAQGADEPGEF